MASASSVFLQKVSWAVKKGGWGTYFFVSAAARAAASSLAFMSLVFLTNQ